MVVTAFEPEGHRRSCHQANGDTLRLPGFYLGSYSQDVVED